MCELTWAVSSRGYRRHLKDGTEPCPDCVREYNIYHRQYRAAEYRPRYQWWTYYRLRPTDVSAILASQHGKCAICEQDFPSRTATHIDHDHSCDHPSKGKHSCPECVRGIVCSNCNQKLKGLEDKEWLKRAVDYMQDDAVAEIIRMSKLW